MVGLLVGLILAAFSMQGFYTRMYFGTARWPNGADVVVTLQWARSFFLDRRVLALGLVLGVLLSATASASLALAYK
jgi:hypothetical protein